MASMVYNSLLEDMARCNVDFDTDTFKMMLVTSTYTPNKDTHNRRDDVTNEVSGTGYSAGGTIITASLFLDTANDRLDISWSSPSWASSSITARGGVIYKSRGGASSADELVGYIDFGADITSTSGTFTVTVSTPLRLTNPS
jgi:hypothetical protein